MKTHLALLASIAALTGCEMKSTKPASIAKSEGNNVMSGCSSNAEGNLIVCGGSKEFIDREITPYFGELKPIKERDYQDDALPPHANRLNESGDIPFVEHDFGARCFDTWGCQIEYAGRVQITEPEDTLSAPFGENSRLKEVTQSRVKNFPAPAKVTWKSKDGEPHVAYVDLAKILWEQRFIHHVPAKDIRPNEIMPNPRIDIFVDDRRLSVSMGTVVKLKHPIEHYGSRIDPHDPELVEIIKVYEKYF
ncbi:hypothetical protein [Luteibacter sp. CQ10]|uniref:hypothetical protein n=1 Tax=Luteibacter sp. CQ10 TaxID=2805821 RepID=UPI0034A4B752